MLFAVDPGVKQCAVAEFEDERLSMVQFRDQPIPCWAGEDNTCICEFPEQRGRSTNVRMSDIIALTWAGSRVCANLPTETVKPSAWKGQVPKAIHHKRMEAALTPEERIVLRNCLLKVPGPVQHNLKDAVALGLWKLGRLGRGSNTE
jgi:hypothetical protein